MSARRKRLLILVALAGAASYVALLLLPVGAVQAAADSVTGGEWPWWTLPLGLFGLTLVLGVLAVLAGVGGGVLFVPIVSGFAPSIHIDFVRGAGLMVALSGALAAGPRLLDGGLVNLRLAIPISLMASSGAIVGAMIGLALPPHLVQIALGVVILVMAVIMTTVKPSDAAAGSRRDPIAVALGIGGVFPDPESGKDVPWEPRRMALGLVLFLGVGVMAGMFGLGAGWANVPVLNLVMGIPLRFAVATSYFLLAITDTSAVLIYLNRGALLPLVAIPAVLGIMLGARFGSVLLVRMKTTAIRKVVIGVLVIAGLRALLRGFGI